MTDGSQDHMGTAGGGFPFLPPKKLAPGESLIRGIQLAQVLLLANEFALCRLTIPTKRSCQRTRPRQPAQ